MDAARKGNLAVAALYLNTPLRDAAAAELAQQLFVVLDARLPARLPDVSDRPEGSLANPLKPNQDVVGTIATDAGPVDVLVERVTRGNAGRVWLFSLRTLDLVPSIADEVRVVPVERFLPGVLTRPRIGGIRLFDWIAMLALLPAVYSALGLVRRNTWSIPGPLRLLAIAAGVRAGVRALDLPLVERQFWSATTATIFVVAIVWLATIAAAIGERYLQRRVRPSSHADTTSLLRLGRRVADLFAVVVGLLVLLHYFGIDATAALAGLGIGGIAVALAAQKTLENVVGGLSIIFDRAVRVGDSMRVGSTSGTVEYVGLRSTRIRTQDRTIVTIPNGQIASANVETLSERDKFWFRHAIGIAYGAEPDQLRSITGAIRDGLFRHTRADDSTIRVHVVRFAAASIDVEVSVYLFARDWDDFLEMQQALLLDIMTIVETHGTSLAFTTQTTALAAATAFQDVG